LAARPARPRATPQRIRTTRCRLLARSAAAPGSSTNETPNAMPVVVAVASGDADLRETACIRADAYFEDDSSRFRDTFRRQFAERELARLAEQTVVPRSGGRASVTCLVARDSSGRVVASADVRPPRSAVPGARGRDNLAPAGEEDAAFVLNVCVREDARGRGVGAAVMRAAIDLVRAEFGSPRVYAQVDEDNTAARALYKSLGFRVAREASEGGRMGFDRMLLCLDLE